MNADQFEQIAEARISHCRTTLLVKGKEYARGGDRLHNFKTAARINGTGPTLALWGMLAKHVVSVHDMVLDAEQGQPPTPSMLREKITDWINYGLLLEGLLIEQMEELRPDYWMPDILPAHANSATASSPPENALGNLVKGVNG
jgi:hypothetical protein